MAIIGTCLKDSKVNFELVKALITGYQSIRRLSDVEIEAIQLFCIYAGTTIAFWRFRQFNIIFSNSNLTGRYKEMVEVVESILKIPPELFLETIFK
ncbi:MAG: hypothetical protein IH840_13700 [Candidatus Heimdallarchaeota archaeon]|nr:hypothetical protein [Candidatus Heimdallarchaeota archaeon]